VVCPAMRRGPATAGPAGARVRRGDRNEDEGGSVFTWTIPKSAWVPGTGTNFMPSEFTNGFPLVAAIAPSLPADGALLAVTPFGRLKIRIQAGTPEDLSQIRAIDVIH
jgi:hypothetical protein